MRIFSLMFVLLTLANCGIQRPLVAPKDIPAYEEKQRKKREQLEEDIRQENAAREEAIKRAATTSSAQP